MAISLKGLTKRFGDHEAVDHLDLEVRQGSVFGFLGPNGAGKTTTIRMLLGLARASSGSAHIMGRDVAREFQSISPRIGYLPEVPAFYGWMRADEYLRFCGRLFKIADSVLEARIASLLGEFGLRGVKKPIEAYSRGMRQRLGVAQALVNEPDILFLDEPTSALDPIGRREILELIDSFSKERTVFLSTHILSDVERVCDEVAIIKSGRLITHSSLEKLKEAHVAPVFDITFDELPEAFLNELRLPWVSAVEHKEKDTIAVRVNNLPLAERELPRLIAKSALRLRHFQLHEESLEDTFIKLVGEDD